MMEITENNHALVLNASLKKSYNQGRLKGKLTSNDIYILNVIYNLLSECNITISEEQRKQLECLYKTLYNNSSEICKIKTLTGYPVDKNTKFIVADKGEQSVVVTIPTVVYWQESLGTTYQDILDLIATGTYLGTKEAATREAFVKGVDIDYSDIGLIAFALNCTEEDDKYALYDILGNDVTAGFFTYYNADLGVRIF